MVKIRKFYLPAKFYPLIRSSHPDVLCEKGVLRNFAKFTEKRDSGTSVFL